ncbi:MAG: transposase [Cyclobacteriaceae bacterium]
MGSRYKIRDQEGLFFVTFTVTGWVDLFIRNDYRDCVISSFKYCRDNKGLNIHAFVIMTSHIHAILSAREGYDLTSTIRDLKKFTSKRLIESIQEIHESRREWMLNKFRFEANRTKRGKDYQLWKEGYHAKQIETNEFLEEKLDYVHQNPVVAGFVSKPEDFVYSSASNYAGEGGVIDVDILD